MEEIQVIPLSESFIQIKCSKSIMMELWEYFSFRPDNYKFDPRFKNRIWDGYIRLLELKSGKLLRGLLPHVIDFAGKQGYSIDIGDLDLTEDFPVAHAEKFIKLLNLPEKYDVFDHQKETLIHCIRHKRATILSPTSSGKSLSIYMIVRQLLDYKCKKGLIVVPTTSLVSQLSNDMEDYGWDIDTNIHQIWSGKEKTSDKSLTISTWQSLYKMPKEFFDQFDFVIVDEVHLAEANSLKHIVSNCNNAYYRFGLTGTLKGTKTNQTVIEGLFGPVLQVITTKELMDKGLVSELKIKVIILKHANSACKMLSEDKSYETEIKYVIGNGERNDFIKNLTISLSGVTLLLFQYVDSHGKILEEKIKSSKMLGDRKVYFIDGDVDPEIREDWRQEIIKSNNAIIIASYGTYSTGINIPNMRHVIFGSPSKSRIRNLQSIGRGIRLSDGKSYATLYDIADDLSHGKRINHGLNHLKQRLEIYNGEKFTYKLYKVRLKDGRPD